MRPFVRFEEMLELDRLTIAHRGGQSFDLMKAVSEEAAEILMGHPLFAEPVMVFCGPGNNGGDGYCLAEFLRRAGKSVFAVCVESPRSEDCKKASRFFKGARFSMSDWRQRRPLTIVDAIYGLNGKHELSRELEKLLKALNSSGVFRVSMDCPTGMNLARAKAHSEAFAADLSLVVGYPKTSMLQPEVAECLGQVTLVSKAFPLKVRSDLILLEPRDFAFSRVKRQSHKGDFGKAAIVGGSAAMPGAGILAAEAASRVGAGYSTLFFAQKGSLRLRIDQASFIFRQNWVSKDLLNQTSWVLGCGGLPAVSKLPFDADIPVVLDAEALTQFRTQDWKRIKRKGVVGILTPHAGEAAKMLQWSRSRVEQNPIRACEAIVEMTGQSCYLKGAPGYLIFSSDHPNSSSTYVNLSINPVFAKAGSGDVLSGILGGFLAQRPKAFVDAVSSALIFQNQVGEILRARRAVISSDQLNVFSDGFQALRRRAV